MITAPDLPDKLAGKMVNGAKEFHLHCMPVKREFLPGLHMDVWGFNGTMPGPTIEARRGRRHPDGDRLRHLVYRLRPAVA